MNKMLTSIGMAGALALGMLGISGSAKAECSFGPVSNSTYNGPEVVVSSTAFFWGGRAFTLRGWNQVPWGFRWSWSGAQRNDANCHIGNVHGATYTSELRPNGTNVNLTTPWTNLQCGVTNWKSAAQSGNSAINRTQVQVWVCG